VRAVVMLSGHPFRVGQNAPHVFVRRLAARAAVLFYSRSVVGIFGGLLRQIRAARPSLGPVPSCGLCTLVGASVVVPRPDQKSRCTANRLSRGKLISVARPKVGRAQNRWVTGPARSSRRGAGVVGAKWRSFPLKLIVQRKGHRQRRRAPPPKPHRGRP